MRIEQSTVVVRMSRAHGPFITKAAWLIFQRLCAVRVRLYLVRYYAARMQFNDTTNACTNGPSLIVSDDDDDAHH